MMKCRERVFKWVRQGGICGEKQWGDEYKNGGKMEEKVRKNSFSLDHWGDIPLSLYIHHPGVRNNIQSN